MFSKHGLMTPRLRKDVILRAPDSISLTFTCAGHLWSRGGRDSMWFHKDSGHCWTTARVKDQKETEQICNVGFLPRIKMGTKRMDSSAGVAIHVDVVSSLGSALPCCSIWPYKGCACPASTRQYIFEFAATWKDRCVQFAGLVYAQLRNMVAEVVVPFFF